MTDPADITLTLAIPGWEAERLSVLIDPDQGLPDLASVIGKLLDHVQQGVYRSGAWEREWLMQAFGDSWLARMEPDPESPYHERPIRPCPNDPPCEHPESAHDPGAGSPGDAPWCLDCDCGDEEAIGDG